MENYACDYSNDVKFFSPAPLLGESCAMYVSNGNDMLPVLPRRNYGREYTTTIGASIVHTQQFKSPFILVQKKKVLFSCHFSRDEPGHSLRPQSTCAFFFPRIFRYMGSFIRLVLIKIAFRNTTEPLVKDDKNRTKAVQLPVLSTP